MTPELYALKAYHLRAAAALLAIRREMSDQLPQYATQLDAECASIIAGMGALFAHNHLQPAPH